MNPPSILSRILDTKRLEIARAKQESPAPVLTYKPRPFAQYLRTYQGNGMLGIIAEIKHKSPSKGVICADFDPAATARAYESVGASCLSILTDVQYFGGSDDALRAGRAASTLPILRKDFIIDPYQIECALDLGADCVLLIVACLEDAQLHALYDKARTLGLDVLIEIHTQEELNRALKLPRDRNNLYGINNRNLNTFHTSLETTKTLGRRLMDALGEDALLVSESGIASAQDLKTLAGFGATRFLIGEQFMKAGNAAGAGDALSALISAYRAMG